MIWIGFPVVLIALHLMARNFSWFRNMSIVKLFYTSSFWENIPDLAMLALIYWVICSFI